MYQIRRFKSSGKSVKQDRLYHACTRTGAGTAPYSGKVNLLCSSFLQQIFVQTAKHLHHRLPAQSFPAGVLSVLPHALCRVSACTYHLNSFYQPGYVSGLYHESGLSVLHILFSTAFRSHDSRNPHDTSFLHHVRTGVCHAGMNQTPTAPQKLHQLLLTDPSQGLNVRRQMWPLLSGGPGQQQTYMRKRRVGKCRDSRIQILDRSITAAEQTHRGLRQLSGRKEEGGTGSVFPTECSRARSQLTHTFYAPLGFRRHHIIGRHPFRLMPALAAYERCHRRTLNIGRQHPLHGEYLPSPENSSRNGIPVFRSPRMHDIRSYACELTFHLHASMDIPGLLGIGQTVSRQDVECLVSISKHPAPQGLFPKGYPMNLIGIRILQHLPQRHEPCGTMPPGLSVSTIHQPKRKGSQQSNDRFSILHKGTQCIVQEIPLWVKHYIRETSTNDLF